MTRRRRGGLQLLLILGPIVAIFIGGLLLIAPNEPLLEMAVSKESTRGEFAVDEGIKLRVWAKINAKHPGIDYGTPQQKLPHVFDYNIIIRQGETTIAELRCNPFNARYHLTSNKSTSKGRDTRRFEGPLEGCLTPLPAGTYQVEAKLLAGPDEHQGFVLLESELWLEAED